MGRGIVESNLTEIWREIESQKAVLDSISMHNKSFLEQLEQMREWIEDVGEYGIAYESIVCTLEAYPFQLPASAAVKLLEVGLLMGFKTSRDEDKIFESQQQGNNAG